MRRQINAIRLMVFRHNAERVCTPLGKLMHTETIKQHHTDEHIDSSTNGKHFAVWTLILMVLCEAVPHLRRSQKVQ